MQGKGGFAHSASSHAGHQSRGNRPRAIKTQSVSQNFLSYCQKVVGFLHVRADPVVAKAFPQFVFPCGQGPFGHNAH